jgi:hypothetical protein
MKKALSIEEAAVLRRAMNEWTELLVEDGLIPLCLLAVRKDNTSDIKIVQAIDVNPAAVHEYILAIAEQIKKL